MNALFDRDGPFKARHARLFVLFTTLYNARAYYPVLAVLFTDLGLRLDQYLLLNAVWAAAIFLFEVPSGALFSSESSRLFLRRKSGLVYRVGNSTVSSSKNDNENNLTQRLRGTEENRFSPLLFLATFIISSGMVPAAKGHL